jgi:hypothetical protein
MDITGRMHGNVPVSMQAIRYASELRNAVTLIEVAGEVDAPMSGLVGLDGKKLG